MRQELQIIVAAAIPLLGGDLVAIAAIEVSRNLKKRRENDGRESGHSPKSAGA